MCVLDLFPFAHKALFSSITFRTLAAFLTSFFLTVWWGPAFIAGLRKRQRKGQPIRDDGPQSHRVSKKGTPTMGGILILAGFLATLLFWVRLGEPLVWWLLTITLGFGLIGFADDCLKVKRQKSEGLKPLQKMVAQLVLAVGGVLWLQALLPHMYADTLNLPFFKHATLHLSYAFPLFAWFVLIGSANAVNLTDGLDGLAVGPLVVSLGVLGAVAYVVGNAKFATYLYVPHIPGAGEMMVLAGALIGACLGFLWYNAPPASLFMGDTGSMAMGGFLGGLALITKHEIIWALVGGIFVVETLSVIMQIFWFKTKRRRLFLMAPLHHHFEHKGWSEPTIVVRFWIISLILGVLALTTLKIR